MIDSKGMTTDDVSEWRILCNLCLFKCCETKQIQISFDFDAFFPHRITYYLFIGWCGNKFCTPSSPLIESVISFDFTFFFYFVVNANIVINWIFFSWMTSVKYVEGSKFNVLAHACARCIWANNMSLLMASRLQLMFCSINASPHHRHARIFAFALAIHQCTACTLLSYAIK